MPAGRRVYVAWEMDLLAELGFGLDLARCAATGATTDLVYVSPKTGRAVSAAAGEPYRDRLLALPPFLRAEGADVAARAQGRARRARAHRQLPGEPRLHAAWPRLAGRAVSIH